MTKEEQTLVKDFKAGIFDGIIGNSVFTDGGSEVWTEIKKGIATRYKQGPTRTYFDGKENIKKPGVLHTLATWSSDEDILFVLKKWGYLINNDSVREYSAKFKGKI